MKYDRTDSDWHWGHEARCKGADVELFFPPRDKNLYKKIANQAKVYCFGENGKNPCPVQKYCLWDAVERDELHGIWGGMSHRERNAVVRRWKRDYSETMTLKEYIFSERV
jgi:WhiB family transcriptional regulator, redox-sensing transcriptional regulator